MLRYLGVTIATMITASAVLAQSSPPAPSAPPATTVPPASTQATPAPSTTAPSAQLVLNDEQAKTWVDKPVYSSDGQDLGEVAAFVREGNGRVTELHADLGGFLGMGETRVRLTPGQFQLGTDRIIINMTAEQAKALPSIPK